MGERSGPDRWLFDFWSRFYDAPLVQRLTYQPEHDAVLRSLRRAAHGRVLDVGCDFSRGMLAKAAVNARFVNLAQGSAVALPFNDASFDAIVSTEAFHWFPDQDAALREFFRLLVPKGRMFVSLVNPPLESMSRAGHRLSRLVGEPARWPTRRRMRSCVEQVGFRVESQRIVLRLPAPFLLPSVLTIAARPE
jgi:ubiquinone/menaquinone biosynthesis C-methylase UbiE